MMEKLGIGINIGNTMEAFPSWDMDSYHHMDYETVWGEPRAEKWHFEAIKLKGFDSVRIPVNWEVHMDENYNIYPEWMDRIVQVVDWALETGLYVVLNTHHQEGLYKNIFAGPIGSATFLEAEKQLSAAWTQVATRFRNHSERLIFEVMNEPHSKANGFNFTQEDSIKINRLNFIALEAIRKVSGNNEKRVVGLTTPGGLAKGIPLYEHPTNDPYTMLCVTAYPNHEEDFVLIKSMLDKGIGVFIEETGPALASENEPWWLPYEEMMPWAEKYFPMLAEWGLPMYYWNTSNIGAPVGENWSIFNRHTGEWPNKPILDAFFAAYKRTPGPDFIAPIPAFPYDLRVPLAANGFTYWTIPLRMAAEKVVVEFTGTLDSGYTFVWPAPAWTQFDNGHARIIEESGKLTFDIRGMTGASLGFAAWGAGDAAKITRVYLDTWAGTTVIPPPPLFSDLTGVSSEGLTNIAFVAEQGLMRGSGGNFMPFRHMSNIEFITVLSRMATPGIQDGSPWYKPHLDWAQANGIVDAGFNAEAHMTRQDMALWMYRYITVSGISLPSVNGKPSYTDISSLSAEHRTAAEALFDWDIIRGATRGTVFGTGNNSERVAIANVLARYVRELEG
jgi:endoglucanase